MGSDGSGERREPEDSAGAFLAGFGEYSMPSSAMTDQLPAEPTALQSERMGPAGARSTPVRWLDRLALLTVGLVSVVIIVWIAVALLTG